MNELIEASSTTNWEMNELTEAGINRYFSRAHFCFLADFYFTPKGCGTSPDKTYRDKTYRS